VAFQDERPLGRLEHKLGTLFQRWGHWERAEAHYAMALSQLAESDQHLQRSLELAQRLQDPGVQIAALNNLALVLADQGDLDSARSHAARALALCQTIGDRHRQAALHSNLADLLHRAGRREEAVSHLKRSAILFADVGVQEGEYQPEIWKLVEW
jgi:tetratricopeptide (TPR) repeat protein